MSVAKVLGLPNGTSWRTKRDAKAAKEKARGILKAQGSEITLREFWEWWTTDPLFSRPKESTDIHNRERTKGFVESFGDLRLLHVGDHVVAQWLRGGKRNGTVPALRAMFNDAKSAKAGRLIDSNPFADLGLAKTKGNKDRRPPTEEQITQMVEIARRPHATIVRRLLRVRVPDCGATQRVGRPHLGPGSVRRRRGGSI